MAKIIIIIGTLNTKELEGKYIRKQIERFGHKTIFIDVSMRKCSPSLLREDDISNEAVIKEAGSSIEEVGKLERMPAIDIMVKGATIIVNSMLKKGKLDGILGYGGSMGESIASLVEKALPLEIPKILVTTSMSLAVGSVGPKNICIFPTVTDMNGKSINKIEAITIAHAAAAISGMVDAAPELPEEKDIIVASQYGNTTPHIEMAQEILSSKGYEFISFHAVGSGGETLEEIVENGMVAGVLDITTHEVVDNMVGGFSDSGPGRMEAAGRKGIPQVIAPGCLDMIQFWSINTVPEKFKNRDIYMHNPNATLIRTNKEESIKLGKVFANKVNIAKGPTAVIIPLKGWSIMDTKGKYNTVYLDGKPTGRKWYNEEANNSFVESLEKNLDKSKENIELLKFDLHINDPKFVQVSTSILDDMLNGIWKKGNKY